MTQPTPSTPHEDGAFAVSLCTGSAALDLAVEAVTGLPVRIVGEKAKAAFRLSGDLAVRSEGRAAA